MHAYSFLFFGKTYYCLYEIKFVTKKKADISGPLFLDPYAGCLIPPFTNKDMKQYQPPTTPSCHYCIATKFIDDKLLSTLNHMEGLRQVFN